MRQVRDVIMERREQDRDRELRVREVELQTLASYIAASAGHKKGVAEAKKIRLVPARKSDTVGGGGKQTAMIPYEKVGRMFGG